MDKLIAEVNCLILPSIMSTKMVRVSFKFADNVKSISPSDRFMFTMSNIRNPQTLKPSDSFQIFARNQDLLTIN